MANLESGVAITPASVFHVASISKQFTAMSILLLAQRGQLSLDDEARKYITELTDYGTPLTIRHLLTHTSGLRDAFLLQGMAAPREDDADKNDAIVKILSRQRALNSRPGTEFQYNNGGYVLLGVIVKRVSGQSLRAFTDVNIFKPLGMTRTHFHDDPRDRAESHLRLSSGREHRPTLAMRADPGGLVGNTGLFTTAGDLLLWEQNFADLRVGDTRTRRRDAEAGHSYRLGGWNFLRLRACDRTTSRLADDRSRGRRPGIRCLRRPISRPGIRRCGALQPG